MIHTICRILEKATLTKDYFRIRFAWPSGGEEARPGQFFTLRCSKGSDPLLRRPFAFSDFSAEKNEAAFIFQVRGRATTYLSSLSEGTELDLLGPLGKGFLPPAPISRPMLAAGGIGLGPMLFLARTLAAEGRDPVFIFGARSAELIPRSENWPEGTVFCTDDGSEGFKGSPVSWLEGAGIATHSELFACGPYPFLKALAAFARKRGIPCSVAVEQMMACGVGACMGCAVKLSGEKGYARACADGPVFDAEELSWE
jgi:dihydroorotate dehydrogenase electron transfer subunit